MQSDTRVNLIGRSKIILGLLVVTLCGGCEMNSFMDPSVVGRWERTPVVLPILDQLDVIDEPSTEPPGLTQVQPEDLIPVVHEYVIGSGDLLTVTVFELLVPGVESVQTRRVDELGMVRLPVIGPLKAEGATPSQLERNIADILEKKGVLKDATVSVIVQEQRQNTFSVIGESSSASTAIGTYSILGKEFRLLDAMALARGVPGQIKKLYVIRQTSTNQEAAPSATAAPAGAAAEKPVAVPENPADLIQNLLQSTAPKPATQPKAYPAPAPPPAPVVVTPAATSAPPAAKPAPAPAALDLEGDPQPAGWTNVDGQWIRVQTPAAADANPASPAPTAAPPPSTTTTNAPVKPAPFAKTSEPNPSALVAAQRIIEIPYDKLLEGDTRYNIIIRPGDVIRVPAPVIGNIYIGGAINRPGTYALPGDRDLTLQQLIFAAGNLASIAVPERVDLIRRIGHNQAATVRLDLHAIFSGTQPDIFLKPNDTINIGTNFMATPLAVIRNGFRMSYGFGFIMDRNFADRVYGPSSGQ